MKKVQIRQGVFETNSSSTHSITICSKQQFEDFISGKVLIDYNGNFILKKDTDLEEEGIKSWNDYGYDYETFTKSYTTPNGEEIVAFGYYGHD